MKHKMAVSGKEVQGILRQVFAKSRAKSQNLIQQVGNDVFRREEPLSNRLNATSSDGYHLRTTSFCRGAKGRCP